jgi:hypothetical protein
VVANYAVRYVVRTHVVLGVLFERVPLYVDGRYSSMVINEPHATQQRQDPLHQRAVLCRVDVCRCLLLLWVTPET